MTDQNPSALDRLVSLAAEAEQILARGIASHDIRHACALARGYLELALSYGEPVSMENVERLLARLHEALEAKLASAPNDDDSDWLRYASPDAAALRSPSTH